MPSSNVVAIQIDHPNMLYFDPLQESLFGGFRSRYVRGRSIALEYPDDIPGTIIRLDITAKQCEVIDALGLKENETIRKAIDEIHRRHRPLCQTGAETKNASLNRDELASWLWHMRHHVNAGNAKCIEGDINQKVPGRIRCEYGGDWGFPYDPEKRSGIPQYLDEFEHRDVKPSVSQQLAAS